MTPGRYGQPASGGWWAGCMFHLNSTKIPVNWYVLQLWISLIVTFLTRSQVNSLRPSGVAVTMQSEPRYKRQGRQRGGSAALLATTA